MKKILVGLLVMVFCLSLMSVSAIEMQRDRIQIKTPSDPMRFMTTWERSTNLRILTFRCPRAIDPGTIPGEFLLLDDDSVRARIFNDTYDSHTMTPSIVYDPDEFGFMVFSFVLPRDNYSFEISALAPTPAEFSDAQVHATGTIDLTGSSKTVDISWIEGGLPTTTTTTMMMMREHIRPTTTTTTPTTKTTLPLMRKM